MTVSLGDYALFVGAAATATFVEWQVRRQPLTRLCARLGLRFSSYEVPHVVSSSCVADRETRAAIEARRQAVRRAYQRLPLLDTCLRRSLSLGFLLRRYHPTIHVGVRKAGADLEAHAWLTVFDEVLDPNGSVYTGTEYVSLQRP